MNTYISLLRGINVAGQKKIKMEDLRKLYESLGFKKVQSYIQTGNVFFQSPESKKEKLIQHIQDKIQEVYGYSVTVVIKTSDQIETAIKNNPYKNVDESKIYVAFLKETPTNKNMEEIRTFAMEKEQIDLIDDCVYFYCPNGAGKSKLSNNLIEKKLGIPATTRNWRTTNKLLTIAHEITS